MFDTMKTAKRIREARIRQNMTQMALADELSVSYQAVSNWERGNSMPDISKLGELSQILHISLAELLGTEEETRRLVTILENADAPMSPEALAELAPMLTPAKVEQQAKSQKWDLDALVGIAPFLDGEILDELIGKAEVAHLDELVALAPFLSSDSLNKLAKGASSANLDGLVALAPFLDRNILEQLALEAEVAHLDELIPLAPFLSSDCLDQLVKQAPETDMDGVTALAPFLKKETLGALANSQIVQGNAQALVGLYPFMSQDSLKAIAQALMAEGNPEGLKEATMFL